MNALDEDHLGEDGLGDGDLADGDAGDGGFVVDVVDGGDEYDMI